jgi:hypothetical protein
MSFIWSSRYFSFSLFLSLSNLFRFRFLKNIGTGKTLLARACAAQTNACFLKLAGPQLVQVFIFPVFYFLLFQYYFCFVNYFSKKMFIGDGAKLVRDAFALAKEKAPAIIFIDELGSFFVPLRFLHFFFFFFFLLISLFCVV